MVATEQPTTERTERRHSRPAARRRPSPALLGAAVVIGLLVAVSLAISAKAGAITQNDDWSYVKSAIYLHRHGAVHLQGWGQMFLLGQLFTAQPLLWVFGDRPASLDLYGALAMVLWLSCVFAVARRCTGDKRALLLVVVVSVWPGLELLTSSFMTDAPSAAASLLAVALGAAAIDRRSRAFMIASLVAGLFAFTVREQFVAGALAPLVAVWLVRGVSRRFRLEYTAGAAVLVVVCALLEHVRHQLPNPDLPPFSFSSLRFDHWPPTLVPVLFTVGLAVSPLAVWTLTRLRGRDLLDPGRLTGWVLGLCAIGYVQHWSLHRPNSLVLINYVTRQGAFSPVMVGGGSPIMPPHLWTAVVVVGAFGGVVLAGEIGARLAHPSRVWASWRTASPWSTVMTMYTLLLIVFVVGLAFGGERQYDRYLITLFPGAGLLLLRPSPAPRAETARRTRAVAVAVPVALVTAFLAVISLATTLSTDVRDAAVWHAAEQLHRSGVPATHINAGLDWNGTHSSSPVTRGLPTRYYGQGWTTLFAGSRDCYVISQVPIGKYYGWTLVDRTVRHPYPIVHRKIHIYTYRTGFCSAH